LGNIGAHRIVCTKLPTVGHTREAMTAAGNTATRLLGMHLIIIDFFEIFVLCVHTHTHARARTIHHILDNLVGLKGFRLHSPHGESDLFSSALRDFQEL